MVDGVFFISSALNVKQLSVFNNEERFLQTLETIESIDEKCPSNMKFMFDTSYAQPNPEYVDTIIKRGVNYLWVGTNQDVQRLSETGQRSLAETVGFIIMLNAFIKFRNETNLQYKRFYKISGRYKLNDNFVLDREDFKDAFVFSKLWDSWMSKEQQERIGTNNMIALRMWHMDANLLDIFSIEIYNILDEMSKYNIDVEHAYCKVLRKYKWAICEPIGLEGVIAPTGEIVNE